MIEFLKEHYVWTIVVFIVSVLTFIGSVGGGIGVLVDLKNWIAPPKQEETVPAVPQLKLVNIDSVVGIEAGTDPNDNIHIVNLSAILGNPDTTPIHVSVDRIESNLGDDKCLPDGGSWQTLELSKGITIAADTCSIRTVILPGQFAQGRIDWTLKYGLRRDDLDQIMRIKGGIRVSLVNGKKTISWVPDGDSVHPSGMKWMIVPAG